MKWIGLTGGIATGKSTAKKLIEGRGFTVIDADLISHQLTELNTEGYLKVVSHFGKQILHPDQSLNRKQLGQLIFSDFEKRNQLENILHPLIKVEVQKQKALAQQKKSSLCFYDVPLLFEKKLKSDFDLVVLVWCDPVIQKERLKQRNQLTDSEVDVRLNAQMRSAFKVKNADYCIDNSTGLQSLEKQVESLIGRLASLSQLGSSSSL